MTIPAEQVNKVATHPWPAERATSSDPERLTQLPEDPYYTKSEPEEAPSKAEESQPLGSRVPFIGEEFEASEPSGDELGDEDAEKGGEDESSFTIIPVVLSPVASLVTTPAATISVDEDQFLEGYDRYLRELYTRSRAVRDEIFSQRYRFRSLEREQERAMVTFSAIWRLVLALEAWAGQTNAQRAALWHAI
ncbi:hypothetical protein Tco_0088167 [Tanacetum coccineum]